MVVNSLGIQWEKTLPFLSNLNSLFVTTVLLVISFLLGHIWDMAYRLMFQQRRLFQRLGVLKKILIGDQTSNLMSVDGHIANEIKSSVGQFLNIDWEKTPLEQWIESGKAYETSVFLAYWIEEEDPKLFASEIGRPVLQSHFLHVCGLAFMFISTVCIPIVVIIHWLGINPLTEFDPLSYGILFIGSGLFGSLLFRQGIHKRDIIIEHAFRVFYVIWRKRILEHEANLRKR